MFVPVIRIFLLCACALLCGCLGKLLVVKSACNERIKYTHTALAKEKRRLCPLLFLSLVGVWSTFLSSIAIDVIFLEKLASIITVWLWGRRYFVVHGFFSACAFLCVIRIRHSIESVV